MRCALLLLGFSVTLACSNPVCDREVVARLFDECSLVLGVNAICPELSEEERLDNHVEACNQADPSGDAACYRSTDCEAIYNGACFDEGGPSAGRDPVCVAECTQVVIACSSDCSLDDQGAMCAECGLECGRAHEECLNSC